MHGDRSINAIATCVIQSAHALVADEPQPVGIDEQLEDEGRVRLGEALEEEARRAEFTQAYSQRQTRAR